MDQIVIISLAIECAALFFAAAFLALIMRSWVKAPPSRAVVRTGGFGVKPGMPPRVVMNGGTWVFSFLHEITWVDLGTVAIEVNRTGQNALLAKDLQYVDVRVIFSVHVEPTTEGIIDAARTIGGKVVDAPAVQAAAGAKVTGAVLAAVAARSQEDLYREHDDFLEDVRKRIELDLGENGLVLESVSVLTLQPRTDAESVAGGQAVPAGR
jgi:uncharacterized membrane protein YqiK